MLPDFSLGVCLSVTLHIEDLLCMLYMIRWDLMRPLYGALPVTYVPVRVARAALFAHRYTYAPPRCRISQYTAWLLIPSQFLSGKILLSLYSMVWGWRVLRGQCFFNGLSCPVPFYILPFSPSLLSVSRLVLWGWDLRTDRVQIALSQLCIADLF